MLCLERSPAALWDYHTKMIVKYCDVENLTKKTEMNDVKDERRKGEKQKKRNK